MPLTITSGYKSLNLYFTEPTNTYYIDDNSTPGNTQVVQAGTRTDIDKLYIWIGTTENFVANNNTLIYEGSFQSNILIDRYFATVNGQLVKTELNDNTEYFVRYAITSTLEPDLKIIIPNQTLPGLETKSRNVGAETSLRPWIVKTEAYDAVAGDRIIADTEAGTFTIKLPSNPVIGASVSITDGWNFSINNLILDRNGSKIVNPAQEGEENNIRLNVQGTTFEFIYTGTDRGWDFTATTGPKGDKGINATLLTLDANEFNFVYEDSTKTDTTTPASITFTAGRQNITGTVQFSASAYDSNNNNLGSVTLIGSLDTRVLTAQNFNTVSGITDRLRIRYVKVTATLSTLTETFTKTITISRLDNGSSALVHQLTKENAIVPASTLGVVGSFSGASTLGYLYRGSVNETMEWTITREDTNGLITTLTKPTRIANTSGVIGSITNIDTNTWTATITNLGTTSGFVVGQTISALENSVGRLGGTRDSNNSTTATIIAVSQANKTISYTAIGTIPVAGLIGGLAIGHNRYQLDCQSLTDTSDIGTTIITAEKGTDSSKKTFSVTKSKEGSVFLILDLSNDNVNVATNSDGSGGDYSLATSIVTAFVGSVSVLDKIKNITFTPSAGVTYSVTINGTTYSNFETQLAMQLPYQGQTVINSLSVAVTNIANAEQNNGTVVLRDNGKLTISLVYLTNTYTTEFTVTKAKKGPNGEPAVIFSISADSEIQYDTNTKTYSPTSVDVNAYRTSGTSIREAIIDSGYIIRFEKSTDKINWTTIGTDSNATSKRTLTTSSLLNTDPNPPSRYFKYSLIKSAGSVLLDSEIDVITQDGVNASSVTVDVENDTHQIPFNAAGIGNYLYSGTKIQVFDNNTELRYVKSSTLTAEQWTIESYTADGIVPSMAVFGLPATSVLPNKFATVDQHSGFDSNSTTAKITYSIKACTVKGVIVSGILASQTFTKVLSNAIYRITGAGTITKNRLGITSTISVKGQKTEDNVTSDYGSLTYQVIPSANGNETTKSTTSSITIPTLPTILYPTVSKHGTTFSWSISGGVPSDTWYAQTSGAFSRRVPTTGTNSLNSSGAASFNDGNWANVTGGTSNVGTVTITFYFGSGSKAVINHVVYASNASPPAATTTNKQASINGTGLRVKLYNSTASTTILDEATISIAEDGLDATNIIVDVANDTHDIPADSSGTVVTNGYSYSGTIIQVFSNTEELQYVKRVTGLVLGDNQWTVTSANGSGITPAALPDADSNKYATFGDHSAMTSATASIDYNIEAKLPDKSLIVGLIGRQTFAKINRTAIYRIINTTSISVNKDGTINQITLNTQKIDGTTVTSGFGWITATRDSDAESNNRIQVGANGYETTALATTKKVTIRLYENSTGGTVLDTAQIAVITSGVDGLGSANINYSNDVHIVPITGGASWTSSGGLIRVYEGGDTLTLSGNVRQGIYLGTSGTTTSGSYPTTVGRYNLYVEKVSGDTLTIGGITGEGTTEATLAQWAGTLTQVTSYRITAWVRTLKNQTVKISTDAKLVPTNDITSYSLVVNPSIVGKAPTTNTYTPSSINIKFYKIQGTTTPQLYVASDIEFEIAYSTNGSDFIDNAKTSITTGTNHTNIGTTTGYNYTIPTNVTVQAIRVQAYSGTGASRKLLDEERISVVPTVKGDDGVPAVVKDVTLNIYSGNITKSGTTFSPTTIQIISTAHNFTPSEYSWEVTNFGTTAADNRLSTQTSSGTILTPGTGISGTITVTLRVYETINNTKTLIATKQALFSIVTNGVDGLTGKRVATGYVYYLTPQAAQPAAPTVTSSNGLRYSFTTNAVQNLPDGWSNNAPVFTNSTAVQKYWSARFSAVEGGPGTGVTDGNPAGTLTFAVQQAIGFSGVVTFSSLETKGQTVINGDNITVGYINAERIQTGSLDAKIATIGNAQIGNYIKSNDFNGTINEDTGVISTYGTTGWAIGKGSATAGSGDAVFNKVVLRGYLEGGTVADRKVQVGGNLRGTTNHHGITLSESNWNNIFIRETTNNIVYFRLNDGAPPDKGSITFDSNSGILNVKGNIICNSLTADRLITTGMVSNNSISQGLVFNGTNTWYYGDGGGYYDPYTGNYIPGTEILTYPIGSANFNISGLPTGEMARIIVISTGSLYPSNVAGVTYTHKINYLPPGLTSGEANEETLSESAITLRDAGMPLSLAASKEIGNGNHTIIIRGKTNTSKGNITSYLRLVILITKR